MESRGCRRSRAKLRPSASSRPIRSASSTSTSPKCRRARQALSLVAIDRPSKFAVAQFVDKANTQTARAFLEALVAAVPYRVEIVLTDNGIQFADLPKNRSGPTARLRHHPFDRVCMANAIEHRLTKPYPPWTTDVIDKCFLAGSELFSSRAWVTARQRAGREAQALPRSLHRRTSVAAPVRTRLGPRGFQPETKRA
jgi:hypothetical protein